MTELAPGSDTAMRDVDDLAEPLALQQRCREPAAPAAAAHCRYLMVPGQLVQALDQLAVRDMDGVRNVALGELIGIANIKDDDAAAIRQPRGQRVRIDHLDSLHGAALRAPPRKTAFERSQNAETNGRQ